MAEEPQGKILSELHKEKHYFRMTTLNRFRGAKLKTVLNSIKTSVMCLLGLRIAQEVTVRKIHGSRWVDQIMK